MKLGDDPQGGTDDTLIPIPDDTSPVTDDAPVTGITVTVHPDVHTVLIVDWTQAEAADAAWIEYAFEDGGWLATPAVVRVAGAHQEVLLGIPAERDVTLHIVNRVGTETLRSADVVGTTGALPSDLPIPEVTAWNPDIASPEGYMLGSVDAGDDWYEGPYYAFILDRQGRYVWYWEVPDSRGALYVQPGWDNSHVFVDANTVYAFGTDADPGFFRLTLNLRYLVETALPSFVFAMEEHTGGSVLYHSEDRGEISLSEHAADGTDTALWSCTDHMESVGGRRSDCFPNTIVWDADRDTILWSMFGNNTVFEVDLGTAEVIKQFGQLEGGWTFDPEGSVIDYQHYVNWTADGTIMASTHVRDDRGEMRTREFAVDEATETLTEIWTFGEDGEHYGDYAGEAWRLPNRNTMIGYGTDGAVLEVTHDQEIAWDVEWPTRPNTHLVGHMTLLDDLYALNRGPG